LCYFFIFGALGLFFPFLPLLLSERGLDSRQIASIMVLIPLSNLVVPPLWGTLADVLRARLGLLRLATAGCGLTLLLLVPDWGFRGALVAIALFSLFRAPLSALADAETYASLGRRARSFASVRLWGSVGFVLFVILPGRLPETHRGELVLVLAALLYLAAGGSTAPLKSAPVTQHPGVVNHALQLATKPAMALVLVGHAAYYAGHAAYDVGFSLHLRSLGYSDGLIGAAWAVGVAAEIGLMLAAPRFIHRWPSSSWLMACAVVAGLRWLLLASTSQPAGVLLVQTLHAVTFGLWYLSMVQRTQNHAPEHLRTSLQSITMAFVGLGMAGGYLVSGQVLHHLGGSTLFLLAAGAACLALLLYALALIVRRTSEARFPR
jgi:MFS family permease